MQSSGNLSHLNCMFSAKVEQGDTLPFNFSSNTVNTCPFHGIFAANFFAVLCFLLVVLLFKNE